MVFKQLFVVVLVVSCIKVIDFQPTSKMLSFHVPQFPIFLCCFNFPLDNVGHILLTFFISAQRSCYVEAPSEAPSEPLFPFPSPPSLLSVLCCAGRCRTQVGQHSCHLVTPQARLLFVLRRGFTIARAGLGLTMVAQAGLKLPAVFLPPAS